MILTIHQPEHLPWAGFFHKMMCADQYVVLDHVQFRKNYYQNRNKVVSKNNVPVWLTVPLVSGALADSINEKVISYEQKWINKYLSIIKDSYSGARYFNDYYPEIVSIVKNKHFKLLSLNIELIIFFRKVLGIDNKLLFSSEMGILSSKSNMILDICTSLGASSYISGESGTDYLDKGSFLRSGIELLIQDFTPPVYNESKYHPYMSVPDLLFSMGDNDSREIIMDSGNIREM